MKKIYVLPVFLAALAQCDSQRKVAYELPDAMLPHVRVEYTRICDRGKILYDENCGRCHTTNVGRKEVIPDFKPEELRGYALRVSNQTHEANMPDTLVTEEELGKIMIFLNYKKKNNHKIHDNVKSK